MGFEAFRRAVELHAAGRSVEAGWSLEESASEHPLYDAAHRWLVDQETGGRGPYASAEGFLAYRRADAPLRAKGMAVQALDGLLEQLAPASVVDLGCGEAAVLAEVLGKGVAPIAHATLLEPSAQLLGRAVDGLRPLGVEPERLSWTFQELVDADPRPQGWDLGVATWSLQNLDRAQRAPVLEFLARRVGRLMVAEYDAPVPPGERTGEERVRHYHDRYLQGVEWTAQSADPETAIQGFLMPMLFGAFSSDAPPNHEQPKAAWREELAAADFTDVVEAGSSSHWWAEAFVLVGTGSRAGGAPGASAGNAGDSR